MGYCMYIPTESFAPRHGGVRVGRCVSSGVGWCFGYMYIHTVGTHRGLPDLAEWAREGKRDADAGGGGAGAVQVEVRMEMYCN